MARTNAISSNVNNYHNNANSNHTIITTTTTTYHVPTSTIANRFETEIGLNGMELDWIEEQPTLPTSTSSASSNGRCADDPRGTSGDDTDTKGGGGGGCGGCGTPGSELVKVTSVGIDELDAE
jgi:hypothetical protein